jgi:hypothetical protein
MKQLRVLCAVVFVASAMPLAAFADGTLSVNVAEFTSEVKLKDKIRKQLEGGGMEWGMAGNRLVATNVNKQFVGATINQLTRYGTSTSIALPAGEYTISCVGLIYDGGLSVEKVLSKGGYFNENVMTFRIEDGQTTTISVRPVIRASSGMLLKVFMPEYLTKATLGDASSEEVSLNARTDASIKWDAYSGDLKFKKQ